MYTSWTFIFQLQNQNSDYLVITPDRALFFPSVETIRDQLTSNTTSESETKEDLEANNIDLPREKLPIVLDFSKVCEMDFTAAKVCQFSVESFINRNSFPFFRVFELYVRFWKNRDKILTFMLWTRGLRPSYKVQIHPYLLLILQWVKLNRDYIVIVLEHNLNIKVLWLC